MIVIAKEGAVIYIRGIIRTKPTSEPEDAYLDQIESIRQLSTLAFHKPVTFLVGENGSGKSTLLEAIAVNFGFNPEGGSRNFSFASADTHSGLHRLIRLSKGVQRPKDGYFLRAESFYNVATEVDRLDENTDDLLEAYGGKSLHKQSHGESFLALVLHRFRGNGLYLLDEPEAALSPTRQLSLLAAIHQLVCRHSQFIIATHSPILMAYPNAEILELGHGAIRTIDYRETEPYQITKAFLDHPQRMLQTLLEDDNKPAAEGEMEQ